jgi:hypothetical protein
MPNGIIIVVIVFIFLAGVMVFFATRSIALDLALVFSLTALEFLAIAICHAIRESK